MFLRHLHVPMLAIAFSSLLDAAPLPAHPRLLFPSSEETLVAKKSLLIPSPRSSKKTFSPAPMLRSKSAPAASKNMMVNACCRNPD